MRRPNDTRVSGLLLGVGFELLLVVFLAVDYVFDVAFCFLLLLSFLLLLLCYMLHLSSKFLVAALI